MAPRDRHGRRAERRAERRLTHVSAYNVNELQAQALQAREWLSWLTPILDATQRAMAEVRARRRLEQAKRKFFDSVDRKRPSGGL